MIRVVLTGIFYPMAILRYFEGALKRRENIELCTLGPHTGRWTPWNHGMLLAEKYAGRPDVVVPGRIPNSIPIRWAERQLPWAPDLWIQIDAGFHLLGKPTHGLNTIIATDPHVLNYNRQRQFADVFFSMQSHYSKPDDIILPYAYDPVYHRPLELEKEWDCCLLGLHYEHRDRWVEALRKEGISVRYELGPVFEEARILYGKSRIGLNWSTLKDLNARVFEILAMGLPLVTNRVPGLDRFFEPGLEFSEFRTTAEAVDEVKFLLKHPAVREDRTRRGLKAVKSHTYDVRIHQILEEVGLASPKNS